MTPIEDPREILVIKLSALGDILLITPVLAALAAAWPRARLTVLCAAAGAPILARCPSVHRILAVPDGVAAFPFFRRARKTVAALRATRFDLAIDLQGLTRSWYFLRQARAALRVGKGRFPGIGIRCPHRRSLVRHAVESYFEATDPLGILRPPLASIRVRFVPTAADRAVAAPFLEGIPPIVFAPFAARPSKQWPLSGWLLLGKRLVAAGGRVLVAGSARDAVRASRLAAAIGTRAASVAGILGIGPFGALLSRAAALVSADSFPMHLAAALATPQLALFGPTDPARTGPWQGRAIVLRARPLRALSADRVHEGLVRLFQETGRA